MSDRVEPPPQSDVPGKIALGLVFMTVLLDLIGFGIVLPLLPYYASDMGASPLMVGVIMASYSLMQLLFSPVWGSLSDHYGRRPLLILGLFGSAVSYLVFGLATTVGVLLVSRVLGGVMGATVPVAQAIVADSTTPGRRARGMGMIGAAFGLGFVFGPAIGGGLSHWGYALPGFVAAGITGVNAVAALFLLPESLPPGERSREAGGWEALVERFRSARRLLARPALNRPIFVLFLMTWGFAGFMTTFPLFLQKELTLSAKVAGGMFAYVGLISAAFQGRLIGPLVERHGEKWMAAVGGGLLSAGMLIIGALPTLPPLFVALALIGIGWGCVVPSLQSLLSRRAPRREQGEVLGVNQSSSSTARVVGPIAAGWGFGALGPRLGFLAGGVLIAVAALFAALLDEDAEARFG